MATSGSINYTQTRNEVILDALQIIGAYGIGRTVSSEDNVFCTSILNKMVKAWGAKGLHLWTKEEAYLYLTPNVGDYVLGSTAKMATTNEAIENRLNGALAAAATAVTLDSTTGMAVADVIGIVLTDKTIHWDTIATIPTSTTLTLTTGVLTAASDNALVYTYTTAVTKPLRINDVRRRTGYDSGSSSTIVDVSLTNVRHEAFFSIPSRTQGGVPVQYTYMPKLTSGTFSVWPRPQDGSERLVITYERIIEDLDNASDNFDFPSEWLEALTYQLAVRLCQPFGMQGALQSLLPMASQMLTDLLEWDAETGSIDVAPDLGGC